jgi:hypothetical protein
MKAARCAADIPLSELHVVLYFLCRDSDQEIRTTALEGLRRLPEDSLVTICSSADTHPRILDLLAKLHFQNSALSRALFRNPASEETTRSFLAGKGVVVSDENDEIDSSMMSQQTPSEAEAPHGAEESEESLDECEEEFRSKYQLTQVMGISEKIKMAITGDKEWRMLLIKDTNKLVSGAVIKNPRLTEAEVLFIAKSPVNNDDIIRDICADKEWTKNYQIKKALVENHKTPLHHALRFLSGLTDKDLAVLAKSKNVSSIIATQARRSLLNKKKEK